MNRILTVIGTRPEAIKMAPVILRLADDPRFESRICVTGQHREMLQQALVSVLEHLEDAPWLEQTLGAMGQKHVDYGVTAEMYDYVGASLLATLAEIAAKDWTPELEQAWTAAYGAIASLMLKGADQATPAGGPAAQE